MDRLNTIERTLALIRKRLALRIGYPQVLKIFLSVFGTILLIRFFSNIYLTAHIAPVVPKKNISQFLIPELTLLALFAHSFGAIFCYRSASFYRRHSRFITAPLERRDRWNIFLRLVIFRPLNYFTAGLGLIVLLSVTLLAGFSSTILVNALIMSVLAIIGFFTAYYINIMIDIPQNTLRYLETLIMFLFVVSNPDLKIIEDRLSMVMFNGSFILPDTAAGAAFLILINLIVFSIILGISRIMNTLKILLYSRKSLPPLIRLYTSTIPMELLILTYFLEIGVILFNPAVDSTVRSVVAFMFVLRLVWFFYFLFKTEYRLSDWWNFTPGEKGYREILRHLRLYIPVILLQIVISSIPPILYAFRSQTFINKIFI